MNYGHLGPKHNSPQDSSDQEWQDNSPHTVNRKYCIKDKSLHMMSPIFLTIYRRRKRGGAGGGGGQAPPMIL